MNFDNINAFLRELAEEAFEAELMAYLDDFDEEYVAIMEAMHLRYCDDVA